MRSSSQISVHRDRYLRIYRSRYFRLGWASAFFLSSSTDSACRWCYSRFRVVSFFAGGNLNTGVREDRGNRWVIAVFVIIGFLNAYLPAYTDRKELWTIDGDTIRWLGVALFAAGGALRIWPVFVLGQPIQRLGRDSVGAHSGNQRHLPSYPSPKLSWPANQFTGMEPGFSFGSSAYF